MKKLFLFLVLFGFCFPHLRAQSLTINVLPGQLKEQLLDAEEDPTELVLKGSLNSVDLAYINAGIGKISNVKTLDLSKIQLQYDDGKYISCKDEWHTRYPDDPKESGLNVAFYLSDNERVERTLSSGMFTSITYHHYDKNLGGLFINNKTIKKVILPEWMTTMGDYLFAGSNVEEVVMPNAITKISDCAFAASTIKTFNYENVTEIGLCAFRDSKIQTFDFRNIRKIGERAFYSAKDLTGNITLSNVAHIPESCFYNTKLNTLTIASNTETIGRGAFEKITTLTSVSIAEGITIIDDNAFYGDTGITKFNVPNSIKELGANALPSPWINSCPKEGSVIYFGEIAYSYYKSSNSPTSISIKEGTKTISNSFAQFSQLKQVYIPSSVIKIGNSAFDTYYPLEEITFGANSELRYIGDNCFKGSKLYEFTIPDKVEHIGDYALGSLKINNLPQSLVYIGMKAFYECSLPSTLTLGENLSYIGDDAFSNSNGIYHIILACNNLEYAFNAFSGCGIEKVTIKNNATNIPNNIFFQQKNLTKIVFEDIDAVQPALAIGMNSFGYCNSLKIEALPRRIVSIGRGAFSEASLPETLSTQNIEVINDYAFENCTGLKHLEITDKLREIGRDAFKVYSLTSLYYNAVEAEVNFEGYGCPFSPSLQTVTIGKDVEILPKYLLYSQSNLTTVLFEERADDKTIKIDYSAFKDCSKLYEITLPNGTYEIGNSAFYGCVNLSRVYFGTSLQSIGELAFSGDIRLNFITLPESVISLGSSAFGGCTALTSFECKGENPPICDDQTFYRSPVQKATLKVPYGCRQVYADAIAWMDFGTIIEAESNAIEDILTDVKEEKTLTVYNLLGIRMNVDSRDQLSTLPSGIYLINGKKEIIK